MILLSLLCLFSITVSAQKRNLQIGAKVITELSLYHGFAPGFGGQVVYRIGKHDGIESGLLYQSRPFDFVIYVQSGNNTSVYQFVIAEKRLLLPLLYRFDSKKINFSAGPVLDYYLGWKVRSKDPGTTVDSYYSKSIRFIASAGISKSIYLSASTILEPEIRLNYLFPGGDKGVALNISLRKSLF